MWSELQRAPQMTKWLGVSKQPTNRPVLSQTGSWEQQRRCLVSSASSIIITATMSPCWTAVLISACVTHLLLVTLRCACLRAECDRGKCISHPSVRVYKQGSRLQTGQHGTCHVVGQEALWDALCTCAARCHEPSIPLQTCGVWAIECECSVLKNALSENKPCMKP